MLLDDPSGDRAACVQVAASEHDVGAGSREHAASLGTDTGCPARDEGTYAVQVNPGDCLVGGRLPTTLRCVHNFPFDHRRRVAADCSGFSPLAEGHPPALWPPSTWRISPVT